MLFALTVLFVAVKSNSSSNSGGGVERQTADGVENDDRPRETRQTSNEDDDSDEQPFKPVLIARRPLRPSTEVETERQSVVVVRQSPRLLKRPREQEQEDEDEQQPQVIIRQQPAIRTQQQHRAQQPIQQRLKEQPQQQQQKEPTAQTIRNYNKLNDDGSFTFGYEADDGSFKEETRGTDCVVRGKYGYVDPDGNKREFSYVQGNPCDPNAVSAEDEEDQSAGKADDEENIPANRPNIAAARPKPKKNRPTTTLFQQTFGDFQQPQQSATPRQPGRLQQDAPRRPPPPPQISPLILDEPSSTAAIATATTPSSLQFRPTASSAENLETAIRNLPQPSGKSPQPSPAGANSPLYTTELVFDPATGQYNTVIFQQVPKQSASININQRLPLAPARQQQPQFQQQFQPQFRAPALQPQFQQQRPFEFDFQRSAAGFPSSTASPQQQLVQQQQAVMFQQSQNLFRQQQQQKQQQQLQLRQPQFQSQQQFFPPPSPQALQRFPADPSQFAPLLPKQQRFEQQPEAHQQQFVLVQPGRTPGQQSLAAGQIDAFLRGHNVQF